MIKQLRKLRQQRHILRANIKRHATPRQHNATERMKGKEVAREQKS